MTSIIPPGQGEASAPLTQSQFEALRSDCLRVLTSTYATAQQMGLRAHHDKGVESAFFALQDARLILSVVADAHCVTHLPQRTLSYAGELVMRFKDSGSLLPDGLEQVRTELDDELFYMSDRAFMEVVV